MLGIDAMAGMEAMKGLEPMPQSGVRVEVGIVEMLDMVAMVEKSSVWGIDWLTEDGMAPESRSSVEGEEKEVSSTSKC
jgi:hypothetical protein